MNLKQKLNHSAAIDAIHSARERGIPISSLVETGKVSRDFALGYADELEKIAAYIRKDVKPLPTLDSVCLAIIEDHARAGYAQAGLKYETQTPR